MNHPLVDEALELAVTALSTDDQHGGTAVRPTYIRHKPGQSTVIAVEVTSGPSVAHGYVMRYEDPARARVAFAKAGTRRMQDTPLGAGVRMLGGSAVLRLMPNDARLGRLRWYTDTRKIKRSLASLTDAGDLKCLDAKMGFDGNAIYRHPDIAALRDETEEDPKELAASKFDLNYIALDGEFGCMVNGAGLAMATMDIIKLYGAEPSNFLDVGGGATKEKVTEAFKIITSDPNVKGILVNIFGGIMRCDIIAEGVIAAVKEVGLKVPLVVRLEGTNVELGKEIIRNSGLNVIAADNLSDAAQKIVKAVKG